VLLPQKVASEQLALSIQRRLGVASVETHEIAPAGDFAGREPMRRAG